MTAFKQGCLSIVFVAAVGLATNSSAQDRWQTNGYYGDCGEGVICPYERGIVEPNWQRRSAPYGNWSSYPEYDARDYRSPYNLRGERLAECRHGHCQTRDAVQADGRYQRTPDSPCDFNCPCENRRGFEGENGIANVPRYERSEYSNPGNEAPRRVVPQREPFNAADQIPQLNPPRSEPSSSEPPQFSPPNRSRTNASAEPATDQWQEVPSTSTQLNVP